MQIQSHFPIMPNPVIFYAFMRGAYLNVLNLYLPKNIIAKFKKRTYP